MISIITWFIKKFLRKRRVAKMVRIYGFKKNYTAKEKRLQCISEFMFKERINLYIFSDKNLSDEMKSNLLAVIRTEFESWRISKIIGRPCLKILEDSGFRCISLNVLSVSKAQERLLLKENTKVLVCWNGKIKNNALFAIWRLKTFKKAFVLYKQSRNNYTAEHFDCNCKNPNYAVKALAKQAEEYLKGQNILYIRQFSRSGTIYLVTGKWFRIRISDHPSKFIENSQLPTFNMGLFPQTDGFMEQFTSWLDKHRKSRVFGVSPT